MTKKYDERNRGVLFLNDRKEKDTHPDRKGSINVDGKEYWLSGWNKETSRGDTISLSIEAKKPNGGGQQQRTNNNNQRSAPPPSDSNSFDEDDIPF